jgi:cytidine diphosphoramidate kinase
MVIWITGLSGSGKTTLAKEIIALLKNDGVNSILLDGDEMREVFFNSQKSGNKHDPSTRLNLALQYSSLARLLSKQGFVVVVATISLFHVVHEWNRTNIPNYFEVYLETPMSELKRRDSKGIYSKYEAGEIKNVAGLDLQIEKPIRPDLTISFESKKNDDLDKLDILKTIKKKLTR